MPTLLDPQPIAGERSQTFATQSGDYPATPSGTTDLDLFQQVINVHAITFRSEDANDRYYRWWQLWNGLYFRNSLTPLFITEGNTDYGKYLGFCQYSPERKILIAKRSAEREDSGEFCRHHGKSVRQHEAFADLSSEDYCIALLLLHEMIHQACAEALVDPGHNSVDWADWCNLIGTDLGLTLTHTPMRKGKETVILPDGSKKRVTVMIPIKGARVLEEHGHTRFAEYAEQCRFPFDLDSQFISDNTVTLTEGKLVDKNNGGPVNVLPEF
jgi:hypothetical protein